MGTFVVIADSNVQLSKLLIQNYSPLVAADHWDTQEGAQSKDLNGINITNKMLCDITRLEAAQLSNSHSKINT